MIRTILGPSRWMLFLILVLLAPHTLAQSSDLEAIIGAIEDPYPLRSADTSSPRDTLRTYLRDFTTAVDAWRSGKPRADIVRPGLRAVDTIDFGEVGAVDRLAAMTIDMILLKEILDRVELPPFEDIPDDEEVAQEGITRWTIPNTKIEIAKISEGTNAGEFLFTRETVENLKNYYDLAKDLPYKKGSICRTVQTIPLHSWPVDPKEFSRQYARLGENHCSWTRVVAMDFYFFTPPHFISLDLVRVSSRCPVG